jgi:hypothetical protein
MQSALRDRNKPRGGKSKPRIKTACSGTAPALNGTEMNDQETLKERLLHLKDEHRDLDDAIVALSQRSMPDMIQIQRLKKRKLQLRDEIIQLESKLLPDIIA